MDPVIVKYTHEMVYYHGYNNPAISVYACERM